MTGIIRGLDPQRRIIIPKETLAAAGMEPGDLIEVWSEAGPGELPVISLQKHSPGCTFCGTRDELKDHRGKKICSDCVQELTAGGGVNGRNAGDPDM